MTNNDQNIFYPVKIVGTGPGDPNLLTIKGLRAIQEADVIVYDSNQAESILTMCPSTVILEKLNKRKGIPEDQLRNEVVDVIQQYFKNGKTVVRLKVGDALMFGRGATEAAIMNKRHIPFEIIPGITAANSAAAKYGIRVTEKNQSDAIIYFMAAEFPKNRNMIHHASLLLQIGATLAVYMAEKCIGEIVQTLLLNNISSDTCIVAVSNVDLPGQKALELTLRDFCARFEDEIFDVPTTFFIGQFVEITNHEG